MSEYMQEILYNRDAAVAYAHKWALGRNPAYYNFDNIGGDCTNFVSQCIYAGAPIMNFTLVFGWYYRSSYDRTASWTGVEYLYNFLINNQGMGPYAHIVPREEVMPGDIVQLGTESGGFSHAAVITAVTPTILVAAHTYDALGRPLDLYIYETMRFLHIAGVRGE